MRVVRQIRVFAVPTIRKERLRSNSRTFKVGRYPRKPIFYSAPSLSLTSPVKRTIETVSNALERDSIVASQIFVKVVSGDVTCQHAKVIGDNGKSFVVESPCVLPVRDKTVPLYGRQGPVVLPFAPGQLFWQVTKASD